MIEWLRRQPASSRFLLAAHRMWTFGETVSEIERRLTDYPVVIRPRLDPDSVFTVLAGLGGPGAVVLPPDPSTQYQVPGTASEARLVVFTSGTGGSPKGVRLTLGNLEAACRASMEHLDHGPEDTWLLALPLHHVAGLSIVVRSAYAGGSVLMIPGFDPGAAAAAMRGQVTMVSMVPTMLARTLDHDPGPYTGLRAVLIGGGSIPEGLLERAWEAGIPALPSYGMTETFGQVATLRSGSGMRHRAHPLPGVAIRIEPDGRIAVAGDQVSPGYLGEPDREDRWLVTNDLGEIGSDGTLRVLGRADAVIVTGGENVDPARVETELRRHPDAGEVVVVGVPDPEWGMVVSCLYTGEGDAGDLASWLGERIPGPAVPKRWRRVERIPLTGPGKPDRVAAYRLALDDPG